MAKNTKTFILYVRATDCLEDPELPKELTDRLVFSATYWAIVTGLKGHSITCFCEYNVDTDVYRLGVDVVWKEN